ncbi:MAG: hypothetical protein SFY80_00480 [Verrucomicrobiota bacterium]|nr:hypothetical protein [Verrucomicrobiota bacterium]
MLPDRKVLLPDCKVLLPDCKVLLPDRKVLLPDCKVLLPDCKVLLPGYIDLVYVEENIVIQDLGLNYNSFEVHRLYGISCIMYGQRLCLNALLQSAGCRECNLVCCESIQHARLKE